MNYLVAFAVLCFTALVILIETAAARSVALIKAGDKLEGGVSIFPSIPFLPLLGVFVAWAIDLKYRPYGFWGILALHAILSIKAVGYIIWAVSWRSHNEEKSQQCGTYFRLAPEKVQVNVHMAVGLSTR